MKKHSDSGSSKRDSSAFTEISSIYDTAFSELSHVRRIRSRVQKLMTQWLPRNGTILDLGCGTGIDALVLHQNGFHVLAADPSRGMLDATRRRFGSVPVSLLQMPAEQLAAIRSHGLDGIVSNFGALNCVRDLHQVFEEAYHVLRDNGVFVLCLINRFSLTELLAYLQRGQFRRAVRRWNRSGVLVPVGSTHVLTWYHSLRSIKRLIRDRFIIRRVEGLNILTPPPSFEDSYGRHPRLIGFAEALESRVAHLPGFSLLGDHMVLVLERFE